MLTQSVFRTLLLISNLSLIGYAKVVTLEEARKDLKLPNYSSAERKLVAKQAEFMISNLYVHRDLKVKDFGSAIDPVPRLEKLKLSAGDLSNENFHSSINEIFFDLRDLHTNYNGPTPLACGSAFMPIRFLKVKDGNKSVIVVARKLKISVDSIKDINIGDELISVDGEAVVSLLKKLEKVSGGANDDAMSARAVQVLSFRSGSSQPLPEKNTTKLKLKNANGEEYEKEVPWSAFVDDMCLLFGDRNRIQFRRDLMNLGVDEYQEKFNKVFNHPHPETKEWSWFGEESLKDVYQVALINTPAGKIGYVQLKSFHWDNRNLDIPTVIDSLRHEIETNLSEAIGLVIDVRGNPGGYIVLAEKLIQLFSTQTVDPSTVRMLANKLNEEIFLRANGGAENRWTDAIRSALAANQRYTEPLAITPKSEANSFGQVWFRPVAVLTDASCYSACDLFASGMQDAKAGVIIGLDRRTGAGGANVMEYNVFRMIMGKDNNPFEVLPYGQNMRVSWRQTLRAGLHNGEILENAGVSSDLVIPLKKNDVTLGESKELMKQIHSYIDSMAPKYTSGLGVRKGSSVLLENGAVAQWKEKVYGVDKVEYFIGENKVSEQSISISTTPKEVEFSVEGLSAEWTDRSLVIVGKKNSSQVFRVVRDLRWRGEYTKIPEEGLKFDFEKADTAPIRMASLKGAANAGWQVVNGKLRVGTGPKYDSNILVRANLPLKLDGKGATMVMDLSLVAEDLNDSLRIYVINPDTGARSNLFAGSQIKQVIGGKIPLPIDWDRADLVFEFESDENWNMTGPVLDNLRILQ